jgi:hypothetical protein
MSLSFRSTVVGRRENVATREKFRLRLPRSPFAADVTANVIWRGGDGLLAFFSQRSFRRKCPMDAFPLLQQAKETTQ